MQHLQPNTTLQGGKYKIERKLGQGGFGITYLATQTSLNRYVAIKELFIGGNGQAINDRRGNQVIVTNAVNKESFNQQKEKFKKEALRLSNLNHPNLVKVHEFFEENGTAYFVMEYINGESLRSKLNKEGKLSENLVLKYIKQILPALEAAHQKSIWHLDIKPENIMVDRQGHAYLIDFGASKHIERSGALTTSLALAYTPGYCAPELTDLLNESEDGFAEALREIGPWTDIYSVGATMYNLLTESIPPSSKRIERNGRNAFSFPSDVSSSTQDLIIWMMKPNRQERPKKTNAVIDSICHHSYSNDENTIIEGKVNSSTKKENNSRITEDEIKKQAYALLHQLDEDLYQKKYFIIGAIGGVIGLICGINIIDWDNSSDIPLLLVAFLLGFLAYWYPIQIYVHFKGKDNIKKWKEQHHNDPRCKYL